MITGNSLPGVAVPLTSVRVTTPGSGLDRVRTEGSIRRALPIPRNRKSPTQQRASTLFSLPVPSDLPLEPVHPDEPVLPCPTHFMLPTSPMFRTEVIPSPIDPFPDGERPLDHGWEYLLQTGWIRLNHPD